jgi:protease-4
MTLDADIYVERRRLKRRLMIWRLVAIAAVVGAVVAAVGRFGLFPGGAFVARLEIDGIILQDDRREELLMEIADNHRVKAVIVRVDSPGGSFVGGESLYAQLRDIATKKPVVAVMQGTATSAGYMAALGAEYIIAHQGTLTGSIGVILQTADVTGLLDKIGIKPETFKSGPLKAQPNPLEKLTPEVREATQKVVQDLYGLFIDMVAEQRNLPRDKVLGLADGRVFSGRQAKDLGLIDGIGGEAEAREWLAETYAIAIDLPVKTMAVKREREFVRDLLEGMIGKALFSERLRLDGVISVWHPVLWQ